MAKKIEVREGKLKIEDKVESIYEKIITKFGTGAKIDAPKEHIGKRVYVIIQKD
jgi:putative transposon-encoded protein